MERTVESLYDAWLECRNSQFESEPFLQPIIKRYWYWHGGTDEKVDIKALNAEIAQIVARETELRAKVDAIVAELEADDE